MTATKKKSHMAQPGKGPWRLTRHRPARPAARKAALETTLRSLAMPKRVRVSAKEW